ncbi:hypothetical protein EMCRGX_G003092 [Ephydatia muelleri]
MPSRNRKKRSKQRAEYLQKQDDILSQQNKDKARARYKADPEKKKASVRDSYKADPEKKKASRYQEELEENRAAKRQRYQEDVEENRAAKRQRYQEDVEESRAAKRQKYEDNSAAIKASERNRYWNDPAVRLAKRAAERKRYRRGHRTTTTTQSYSLYEPKSHALMEYNGGLEKAILRDSELLSEVDDAFCKSHPLLAQKVVTRSARAAVSKIGADALVGGRSTSSNSSSLNAATAARYIAAPLPSAASSSCSTAPAEQSCPHRCPTANSRAAPTSSSRSRSTAATCTSPTTGTSIGTSALTTTLPAATLAAATTPPHGSHGQNQAAAAIEEAGGDKEDKAEPYRTLRTHMHIISIIKFFNLPSKIKINL